MNADATATVTALVERLRLAMISPNPTALTDLKPDEMQMLKVLIDKLGPQ